MKLFLFACLAFLASEGLSYIESVRVPSPQWFIAQAAFAAPAITVPFRGPFVTDDDRAPLIGGAWSREPTEAVGHGSVTDPDRPWKPWGG